MPFILLLLLMGTSFAQLPEGFAPPRELLQGPLAEGTLSVTREDFVVGARRTNQEFGFARYDAEEIFRQAPVRVRNLAAPQAFRILKRDAESIANNRHLIGRLTISRNLVVRGLLLVEDLGRETDLRSLQGQEIGAAILVATFNLAKEFKELDSRIVLFGADDQHAPQDRYAGHDNRYPYAAMAQHLARHMFGIIPRAQNPASRLRMSRRIVEYLVWDLSRSYIRDEWSAHIASAATLLREIDAVPSSNQDDNEARIRRIEALRILPILRMQEVLMPFSNDEYSQLKGRVWANFQNNFAEASRCGVVTCGTTNGNGTFISIYGQNDGAVQEQLVSMCISGTMSGITSFMINPNVRILPTEHGGDGTVCRGAMVCNRLNDPPATPCQIRQTGTIYHEGPQNQREVRMPWWPSPY